MASRRVTKRHGRRKAGGIQAVFLDMPKGLIWGWSIWSIAVILTLLVIFAPPLESVKKSAISLITPNEQPNPQSEPVSPAGEIKKSVVVTEKPVEPGDSVKILKPLEKPVVPTKTTDPLPAAKTASTAVTEKSKRSWQSISEGDSSPQSDIKVPRTISALPFRKALLAVNSRKIAFTQVAEKPAKSTEKPVEKPLGQQVVINIRQPVSALPFRKALLAVNSGKYGFYRSAASGPVKSSQKPAVGKVAGNAVIKTDKSPLKPLPPVQETGKLPTKTVLKIAEVSDKNKESQQENAARKKDITEKVAPDIKPFATTDKNNKVVNWDNIQFKGVDRQGKTVKMTLIVLSEDFFWRFGGLSITNRQGHILRIADHLASEPMKAAIRNSRGLICIGTASEEGGLKLEEYRAALRANRLINWVVDTQPQINSVYALGLGQYQKNRLPSGKPENGLSSNDQRRIILINITHMPARANLVEALKNGLNQLQPLPFELQQFSTFDLKDRSSII